MGRPPTWKRHDVTETGAGLQTQCVLALRTVRRNFQGGDDAGRESTIVRDGAPAFIFRGFTGRAGFGFDDI